MSTQLVVQFPSSLALGIPANMVDGARSVLRNPARSLRALGDFGSRVIEIPALLEGSRAMKALTEAGMYGPWVTDESLLVPIDRHRAVTDPSRLRDAIEAGIKASKALYDARWSLPVTEAEREQRDVTRALAKRLELTLGQGELSAEGPYRNGRLSVEPFFQGLSPATRVRFDGRALPFEVRLGEDSLRATLTREQDIQTGDSAFDRRFLVQGNPEDEVRNVFGKRVRPMIFAAWEEAHRVSSRASVRYRQGAFEVTWPGRLSDSAQVLALARALADASDAMWSTQDQAPYR